MNNYPVLDAATFAIEIHAGQRRKYTDATYDSHLAEVAGIVSTICWNHPNPALSLAIAWCHDCREDHDISWQTLNDKFGTEVADGVTWLSDLEEGSRLARKAASRARLARAPGWIQDIKVADITSNATNAHLMIAQDLKFAKMYIPEKAQVLDVLSLANPQLVQVARMRIEAAISSMADLEQLATQPPPRPIA